MVDLLVQRDPFCAALGGKKLLLAIAARTQKALLFHKLRTRSRENTGYSHKFQDQVSDNAWGNLWDGLICLGRFDNGFEPLLVRGEFPVRIERI